MLQRSPITTNPIDTHSSTTLLLPTQPTKHTTQQPSNALPNTAHNRSYTPKQIPLSNLADSLPKATRDPRDSPSNPPPQSSNNSANRPTDSITQTANRSPNRIAL